MTRGKLHKKDLMRRNIYLLANANFPMSVKRAKARHSNDFLTKGTPDEIWKAFKYTSPTKLEKLQQGQICPRGPSNWLERQMLSIKRRPISCSSSSSYPWLDTIHTFELGTALAHQKGNPTGLFRSMHRQDFKTRYHLLRNSIPEILSLTSLALANSV